MSVKHRANDILTCELCRLNFVTEEGLSVFFKINLFNFYNK